MEYVTENKAYGFMPAWKKQYFYRIEYADGRKYRHYNLDDIVEKFRSEEDAVKLYAYTKDLFPTTTLIMWK